MEQKVDLSQLSANQLGELSRQYAERLSAEKEARAAKIQEYKDLVSQTVNELFPRLLAVSAVLSEQKHGAREAFATVLDLKAELYGVKDGQVSHQFINADGTRRVKIGSYVVDNYDDTVDTGIEMVKEYLRSLAKDDSSSMLVDTIMKLLAKDAKGTLKASRVLQLQQLAERSGSEAFVEGVRIIREAYKPVESKQYVRAEYKNESGAWVSVPLGMTEADV